MKRMLGAALVSMLLLTACGPQVEVSQMDPVDVSDQPGSTGPPAGRVEGLAESTAAPEEGAVRGQTGRAVVDGIPQEWTETRVDDQFDLRYRAGEGSTDPLLSISGEFGSFGGARAGVSTLIAQIQMGTPGFTIHAQEDIEVLGASSAVRVDFSFGTPEDEDGVFDAMWIVAVDATNGDAIALALSGGEDVITEADFDQITEGFRMLPAAE